MIHGDFSPQPMTSPEAHDRVVELLADQRRGRVLDIPAGQGALTLRLRELGFDVRGADINPDLFRAPGIVIDKVNLNEKLPYGNGAFDYVVCLAGLQRVIYPEITLQEFHRILREGGRLYVDIPNYLNIRRRLQFLRTGTLARGVDIPEFLEDQKELAGQFRTFLGYPRVKHGLDLAGFRVDTVKADRRLRSLDRHRAFVAYIRLYQWMRRGKDRKAKNPAMLPENNSDLILGSDSLIFCCTAI